jgi:hypothetical protein
VPLIPASRDCRSRREPLDRDGRRPPFLRRRLGTTVRLADRFAQAETLIRARGRSDEPRREDRRCGRRVGVIGKGHTMGEGQSGYRYRSIEDVLPSFQQSCITHALS